MKERYLVVRNVLTMAEIIELLFGKETFDVIESRVEQTGEDKYRFLLRLKVGHLQANNDLTALEVINVIQGKINCKVENFKYKQQCFEFDTLERIEAISGSLI